MNVPRVAYVDTARLMVSFSEAAKVERELKAEDEKWRANLKVLEDSVQAAAKRISAEFDKASPKRKRELQDLLSARNQQVNNFVQANRKRMEKLRQEKMQGIVAKVNAYISEYGEKEGYSIILGTATGGSILYGDTRGYDITSNIADGLNQRYR